jgi:hypothetical protein
MPEQRATILLVDDDNGVREVYGRDVARSRIFRARSRCGKTL